MRKNYLWKIASFLKARRKFQYQNTVPSILPSLFSLKKDIAIVKDRILLTLNKENVRKSNKKNTNFSFVLQVLSIFVLLSIV